MLVKNLIEQLKEFDPDMEVYVKLKYECFDFSPVLSVGKQKIDFKEDPDGETLASTQCVVIDHEF